MQPAGGLRFQTMVKWSRIESLASNLGSGPGCPRAGSDTNLLPDVYAFDRATRCVTRISGSSSAEWWTPSVAPAVDGSGATIVFSSAQPSDADDPTTDFDLFHAVIAPRRRERLPKAGTSGTCRIHLELQQLIELRLQSP